MKTILSLGLMASLLAVPVIGGAQNTDIAELERRVRALEQANINRGANIASTVARAEAIQTEFASVKGAVDSNTHLINGLNEQMRTLYRDLERRIQVVEDQLRLIQDMLKRSAKSGAPRAMEEYASYQDAIAQMNDSEYLAAAAAFQEFIENHPKSKLVGNAQYAVADCYFLGGDYQQAIKQFQIFIERNPRSDKVPDALVKQGASFVELGMVDEAKAFFTKVMRDYPKTKAAGEAKAKLHLVESRGTMTAQGGSAELPKAVDMAYPTETVQQQRAREKSGVQQQRSRPPKEQPSPAPRPHMEF